MSDLQIAPPRERSVVPALLVAVVALAAIAFAVFYFNPHKIAELKVDTVQTFAPHTELTAMKSSQAHGMRVLGEAQSAGEDNLYVIATVRFTDKLRIPIYFYGATAQVTFADGTQSTARMIPAPDVKRLGALFPPVTPMIINPLADGEGIDPSSTRVGSLVFGFAGHTAQDWQKKREASLTLQLRNQDPQTTKLP